MKFLFLFLFPLAAFAQSVPNGTITQGEVWTPAQWNYAWQSKQDYPIPAGGVPLTGIQSISANTVLGSVAGGAPGALTNLPSIVGFGGNAVLNADNTGATAVDATFGTQLAAATAAGQTLQLPPGVFTFSATVNAPSGCSVIKGIGPGPSIIRAAYNNTGTSATLFNVSGTTNSTNVTCFILDGIVLDGGMIGSGAPPNTPASGAVPASGYIAGTPAGGTDASIAIFTASISSAVPAIMTVTAVSSGTIYNGHTVFDNNGTVSGLGQSFSQKLTVASGGPCSAASVPCTLTLAGASASYPGGSVSSETMYTAIKVPLIYAFGSSGYSSQASLSHFGCNRVVIINSVIQNTPSVFANITGCTNSGFENDVFNNAGAGGNDFALTRNFPFINWSSSGTTFTPSSTAGSGATSIVANLSTATCGAYFIFKDMQTLGQYPLIAETTPNTYIANGTVVSNAVIGGGGACTVLANGNISVTAGTLTLTISQATTGTITATTDFVKVYDFQGTGNYFRNNTMRNFGSNTNVITGQNGFICSGNQWYGNYALGNVTSSGGGNASCYEAGSTLPGNNNTVIANNYIFQGSGNGLDENCGVNTTIVGNVVLDSSQGGITLSSNNSATSENPVCTMQDVTVSGNVVKNSHYYTNASYQTGTATANGSTVVNTGNSPVTSIAINNVTGTCAPGSYISIVSPYFQGYPWPATSVNSAGIFGSGWANGTMTLSTGLYAVSNTITNGTVLYCNNRNPNGGTQGVTDANLVFTQSGSVTNTSSIQNVTITGNDFGDDQYAALPTATIATSAQTTSGSTLSFTSTTGVAVGQQVYCTGLRPESTVASFVTNTSVTLNYPVSFTVPNGANCWFYAAQPTILYNVDASSAMNLQGVTMDMSNVMFGSPNANLSTNATNAFAGNSTLSGDCTVSPGSSTIKCAVVGVTNAALPTAGNLGEVVYAICPITGGTQGVTLSSLTADSPAVATWPSSLPLVASGVTNWTCPIYITSGTLPTGFSAAPSQLWIVGSSVSGNTFTLATSDTNALAGTAINGSGSAGVSVVVSLGQQAQTTNTAYAGAEMSIGAGDWLCGGKGGLYSSGSATTTTNLYAGLGTAVQVRQSTGLKWLGYGGTNIVSGAFPGSGVDDISIPQVPYYLSGTTTLYISDVVGSGVPTDFYMGGGMECLRIH